jgi:hypothetical protein
MEIKRSGPIEAANEAAWEKSSSQLAQVPRKISNFTLPKRPITPSFKSSIDYIAPLERGPAG